MSPNSKASFWAGIRDSLVVVPTYLPFALVCGVASVKAGLSTSAAIALPALVYGGSSQAVVTQFIQNSASLWVAILSGCVINLRMAVYSAAWSNKVRGFSKGRRFMIAAFMVDNTFAMTERRQITHPHDGHMFSYYAGLTTVCWTTWVLFCVIGIFAGNIVPASWQLEFAVPLSFIAILSMSVRSVPMAAAALAGGAASVLLFSMPLKLGLVVACAAGLLAGLIAEKGALLWTARKAG